ncbi:hypothetical protein TWF281_006170 [Arthrobotrys megalospora]
MKLQLVSIVGFLALAEASILNRRQGYCYEDSCLRAIGHTTRPGRADCSNYWPSLTPVVTITPATTTITVTETGTSSFTHTDPQTLTNTLHDTLTVTSPTTVIGGSVEVTETITRPLVTNSIILPDIRKRQAVTTWSDSLSSGTAPLYATACSGWIRYSSACSCLLKSTVNAAAPIQTVIATATVSVTITVSPTLATFDVTVTNFSTTQYDPVGTVTVTSTVATATWVSLYIVGRDNDENKANQYLKVDSPLEQFNGVSPVTWAATREQATKFNLNLSDGTLKVESTQEFVCAQFAGKDAVFVYIMSSLVAQFYGATPLLFEYDAVNNLLLQSGDFTKIGYHTANAGQNLVVAKASVNWGRFMSKEVLLEVVGDEATVTGT